MTKHTRIAQLFALGALSFVVGCSHSEHAVDPQNADVAGKADSSGDADTVGCGATVAVDGGTADAATTPTVDAATSDPFPHCDGVGSLPTLGPLDLAGGTRYALTRTCDAFTCGAWSLSPQTTSVTYWDPQSFRINTTGDAWIESQIGPADNDGEYTCRSYDYIIGYAQLDPASGDGVEHVYSGYECNVNGGSGGPRGQNPARDVSVHYGSTCVSAIDAEPAPQEGTQTRYLTIFTW
jgi:hypothetical protein